jgi:hypothetical protein
MTCQTASLRNAEGTFLCSRPLTDIAQKGLLLPKVLLLIVAVPRWDPGLNVTLR